MGLPRTFQVLAMTEWSVILSPWLPVTLSVAKNLGDSSSPDSLDPLRMTLLHALIRHLNFIWHWSFAICALLCTAL
jgi:hypothetical protein